MKHFGDITKLSGYTLPVVDVITGGSPCQDLSVAGKRAGLDGERSGLFMEQIRIVKELRQHDRDNGRADELLRPRYMVWENVPGAFSSNGGKDFQAVLTEIVRIADPEAPDVPMPDKGKWSKSGCIYDDMGRWSIAWRVHDAQFWGVPQRRKRIALVADFGGLTAPEILFERKGLSRHSEPRGEEGQGTAGSSEASLGDASVFCLQGNGIDRADNAGCNGKGVTEDVSYTLNTIDRHAVCINSQGGADIQITEEVSGCLTAATNSSGNNKAVVFNIGSYHSNAWKSPNPNSGVYETDVSKTLDALNCGAPTCNQGGTCVVQGFDAYNQSLTGDVTKALNSAASDADHVPCVVHHDSLKCYDMDNERRRGPDEFLECSPAIVARAGTGGNNIPCVVEPLCIEMTSTKNTIVEDGISPTLTARMGTGGNQVNAVHCLDVGFFNSYEDVAPTALARQYKDPPVVAQSLVRRLTPLECERLQGFPGGWTDIGEWVDSKGKKHKEADSPKYKALGNSIALPFWQWMARRICAQYERTITMASLFDGIGGFPLVFERCGAKAVWASEIEEFPIAVTKLRFPEE